MCVKAIGLFRFELSLETLLKVCSYFHSHFIPQSISVIRFIPNAFTTDSEDDLFNNYAHKFNVKINRADDDIEDILKLQKMSQIHETIIS